MPKKRTSRRSRPFSKRIFSKKILILVISFIMGAGGAHYFRGRVVSVSDGDTLTVFTPGGRLQKIRLYGVDCPETAQPGGAEATALTRELTLFQEVSYTRFDTDRYGREVALVKTGDGRLVNQILVREGHAWVYKAYCRQPICASWIVLEEEARRAKKGVWKQKNPVPPWKWREKHRRR